MAAKLIAENSPVPHQVSFPANFITVASPASAINAARNINASFRFKTGLRVREKNRYKGQKNSPPAKCGMTMRLPMYLHHFFKNALNRSMGSGRKVVVLCSLAISRMVWR